MTTETNSNAQVYAEDEAAGALDSLNWVRAQGWTLGERDALTVMLNDAYAAGERDALKDYDCGHEDVPERDLLIEDIHNLLIEIKITDKAMNALGRAGRIMVIELLERTK